MGAQGHPKGRQREPKGDQRHPKDTQEKPKGQYIYIYIWLCPKTLRLFRVKITALVPTRSLRSYTFLQCFQFFSYVPIRSYCVPTRSASDFEKLLFVFIRSYTFRSSSYAFLHMICKKLLDLYTFLYVPAGRM
jgi:hypothetical protein